jgi:Baseplate J-like protein
VPLITLADLLSPATPDEALALELSIATALGLDTTAWQPVSAARNLYATQAQIQSDFSLQVTDMAQGGYASLAAQMVDANGAEVTSWLDLRITDTYNITRIPATAATGPVYVSNTTQLVTSYDDNSPIHFQNSQTGASYTSVGAGSIAAEGVTIITVSADPAFVGSAGTSAAGVTLAFSTPVSGCTVLPLPVSLVGTDKESNAALLSRGQAKLFALSPNGASQAYDFVARSIPQGVPSTSPPYAIGAIITRSSPSLNTGTGSVFLTVANSAGPPTSDDLAVVNAAIQNQVVPNGMTAVVQGATVFTIAPQFLVVIKQSAGLTAARALSNISTALANKFATLPIGGYNSGFSGFANYIPFPLVLETIMDANPGTVDCNLVPFAGSGGTSGQLAITDVAELGAISGSVTFI